jgi:hypothetical protein
MGQIASIEQRMCEAEQRWGIALRRKNSQEAAGPCPFCPLADEDGFLIWADGGYWCRRCGKRGWIDEGQPNAPSREQILEMRVAALERKQHENERRLAALERMAHCTDHLRYHQRGLASPEAMAYWEGEGIRPVTVQLKLLGHCERCPTDREGRPSYTIPVINNNTLENIRHRLVGVTSDKYRPHMPGLGIQLYNADALKDSSDSIVIVEGEKKAIVVEQAGFLVVGIVGKRAFKREWLDAFARFRTIYVALDPDAKESARRLAALFDGRGRIVDLPLKIDDMIARYGAGPDDIQAFLNVARPIAGGGNGHRN